MTETDFVEDLKAALRSEYQEIEPQRQDEFTVQWFADNIANKTIDTAKTQLETEVKEGRMSVRRHVLLTWEIRSKKTYADVYKLVPREERKQAKTRRPK